MKSKKTRGFTIIELLVVVGIIALLASIVLVSLQNARNKGKDVRIQNGLNQIRTLGELYYQKNNLSYTNFGSDPDLGKISDDISSQEGALVVRIKNNGTGYCAYSALIGAAGQYICVDDTLVFEKTSTDPGGATGKCSITPTDCRTANTCACK